MESSAQAVGLRACPSQENVLLWRRIRWEKLGKEKPAVSAQGHAHA